MQEHKEVLGAPTKSTSNPKKGIFQRRFILITLAILVLASIISLYLYSTHQDSKQNDAYISALSGNSRATFSDPLNQENGSQWSSRPTCQFTGGAYHVQPQGNLFMACTAQGTYSNFAFEVQLTILQGDCAGIVFRNDGNGNFYYFSLYQNGLYIVTRYVQYGGLAQLTPYGKNPAIHTGPGQQNTLAVKAIGNTLTIYINEQQVQQLQDANGYASGSIGLAAYPNSGNSDTAYTNAKLWTF